MMPSNKQIEALKELINIGIGRGASILNTMLKSHIILQVPLVKILEQAELIRLTDSFGPDRLAAVELGFKGAFAGNTLLIFPRDTASKLVDTLLGEEQIGDDMDSIRAGTLCEIGNIVLNGVIGSLANVLKINFKYTVPNFIEENLGNLFGQHIHQKNVTVLLTKTRFIVEKLDIEGDIFIFFSVPALDTLLRSIDDLSHMMGNDSS